MLSTTYLIARQSLGLSVMLNKITFESIMQNWVLYYCTHGTGYPSESNMEPVIPSTKRQDYTPWVPLDVYQVDKAIKKLTLNERQVIHLNYLRCGKQSEKAAKLTMSHSNFRATLSSAKRKLRQVLT